jgi:hypothetical protein
LSETGALTAQAVLHETTTGIWFFLKSPAGKADRIKDRKIKKRCKV